MENIKLFDSTLRDGSHAVRHGFTKDMIKAYCECIDSAGLYTVIVGHGNGLGASSLQVGLSKISDSDMLNTAKQYLTKTKLGAYMIPGFGTIDDDIVPALEIGVELFKFGCHCTEANITRQHIEFVKDKRKIAYGVLMMYHMASTERLLEEAKKMESYGADGVIIMDSAGASTPELVKKTISTLKAGTKFEIGFHPHNNLGLAVANAYIACEEGATIVDGTVRGIGAGAGNCQLEAFAALMKKEGYDLNLNLYKLLDASEQVICPLNKDKGLSDLEIVSGMNGVFSAFKSHVLNAADEFSVDPREIFVELGKRKVVAGQEDIIVEVASILSDKKAINNVMTF